MRRPIQMVAQSSPSEQQSGAEQVKDTLSPEYQRGFVAGASAVVDAGEETFGSCCEECQDVADEIAALVAQRGFTA